MILKVWLGTVAVGTLERRAQGITAFRFNHDYLTLAQRPVLGRWFEDHLSASLEIEERGNRLPAFFQNCLPEEHSALRALLASHAGVEVRDELPLLAALGTDLPGAVIVRPESSTKIAAEPNYDDVPAPAPSDDGLLYFSLAGMQLKFSVVADGRRFTLPMKGQGGRWIVKLPDRRFPHVPENEFSMLVWAKASGISIPDTRLVAVSDIDGLPSVGAFHESNALAIRRFDRDEGGGRIHQEDFAQVLGKRPGDKYDSVAYATVANIVRKVCGEADYDEFVRRLVFVVLSGNADAHLKNWSLVYPDSRRARLSPAYDLVCTLAYGPELRRRLAMNISREKVFAQVTRNHFERMAAKIGASPEHTGELVSETAARVRAAWAEQRSSLPLTAEARQALEGHLSTLLL